MVAKKQQAIFPDLPRDKNIVDMDGDITPHWDLFFQQLVMALQTNFKPEGVVIPPKPTTDIVKLVNDSSNNNIIYDSTTNQFKGNLNGVWKTFTLT